MLYNGVSNRSRGWKSKKPGDLLSAGVEGKLSRQPSLMMFDGAARSSVAWDHTRKDPEMWFRNGNCYVHLYEKGQSRRGAAFKVPFTCLIAAQCQPLIENFVDRSVSEEAYHNGRIDMYIPAPSTASRSQAFQYQLSIRNFFAWIFRRSLVGDQLGSALIGLVNTMDELREPDADNVQDVLDYVEEEGYLDIRNQPNHALAILHLAEAFQLRDLYTDAFVHCVGMSERLYKHVEYSRISVASRKLIRRARVDMDFRLSRAGAMLGDLLREELSEAHLGLSIGARAHLDRFRAYVHGFYATKFGAFPPQGERCGTILRPDVYRIMKADFAALYGYLVDTTFTAGTASAPPMHLAQGGLCSLQSVHEFDLRHKLAPLDHPLPLLPEATDRKESRHRRSLPWLSGRFSGAPRQSKLRPDQRLQAHAALMRATNHGRTQLLENRLVLAYRQFEEDSAMTATHYKGESGVGPADARKVRWLFIYAMYQTLRGCAEVAPEVRIREGAGYHLGCSTKGTPPWGVDGVVAPTPSPPSAHSKPGLHARFPADRGRSISAVPLLSPIKSPQRKPGIEIKPDIDYFALTHQAEESPTRSRQRRIVSGGDGAKTPRSRSQSLTRSMSIRRSLSMFRNSPQRRGTVSTTSAGTASPTRSLSRSSRMSYHEIIVHGYGNGTNSVVDLSASKVTQQPTAHAQEVGVGRPRALAPPQLSVVTTLRSASTSSANSYNSSASTSSSSTAVQSNASASTTPTTLVDPHTPTRQTSAGWTKLPDLAIALPNTITSPLLGGYTPAQYVNMTFPLRRTPTTARTSIRNIYSNDDMLSAASVAEPPPLPRRSSKRSMRPTAEPRGLENKRWSLVDVVSELRVLPDGENSDDDGLQPSPLRIHKTPSRTQMDDYMVGREEDDVFRSSIDWERTMHSIDADVSPPHMWEQFMDLGGLQPIHLLSR